MKILYKDFDNVLLQVEMGEKGPLETLLLTKKWIELYDSLRDTRQIEFMQSSTDRHTK